MPVINCILKHKDLDVAYMALDIDYGVVSDSSVLIPEHMPVSALSTGALSAWWQRRAVPETQDFLKEKLEEIAINNHRLLTKNLGLSLNDAYWICPFGLQLKWKDVNLYENEFAVAPENAGIAFSGDGSVLNLENAGSFFPGSSLQGNLKKRWIKKDKVTYLAKGNYKYAQQSLNEAFASYLHSKQGTEVGYVFYELAELKFSDDSEIGCISKNFTSLNLEYIPARDILWSFGCRRLNEQSPARYIQCLVEMGMDEEEVTKGIWYQIQTDYLMTNVDRHLNNYGILRDTENLKPVCLAPIFDTGNSMFWEGDLPKSLQELQDVQINRAERKETVLLQMADRYDYVDMDRLPSEDEIISFYTKHQIPEQRAEELARWFMVKKEMLCQYK